MSGPHKIRQMMKAERAAAQRRFRRHQNQNKLSRPGCHQCVVVLDHLKPSFNIGKIFRSAEAFGCSEIHLVGIDFFDPAPAMGAFKWVPAYFHTRFNTCYADLVNRGYTLFILEPGKGAPVMDTRLPEKSAFILGHEEFGISFESDLFDRVRHLTIPQYGRSDSLNVSVAASIVLYEYVRQHKDNDMQIEKTIQHIVGWLDNYLENSGLTGFCVGVSGGIDSAVTSALCARTQKPTMVLNLPVFQASDQLSRAAAHNAWLTANFPNVTAVDLDLTPVFSSIQDTFPSDIQDKLTMANSRARLRMLTLYAFASHHRLLVAGTGNKVEDFGVGFYTKYGDGGVDISPIADLFKSEVYALARVLGISAEIIAAPPTDGLWDDNRTDEEQMGATYAELEWAMGYNALPEKEKKEVVLDARQKQVLTIFKKLHAANRHKIDPIPVCYIPDDLRHDRY